MGITGIGSSYNYNYNVRTNKLSTKDGSKDEFVDFYNGDAKGEETENLNHFDAHTKYQIERMRYIYDSGLVRQSPFKNREEVELTAEIESAEKTSFYVNGQKVFTAYTGMSYLPSEILAFGGIEEMQSRGIPKSVQQAAIKRYEERMSDFLKNGNWYRMA